jgi:hypothetical protein
VRLRHLLPTLLHTPQPLHLLLQPSVLSFEHAKGIRHLPQ